MGDLRPVGMTTVGITETKPDGSSSVTTTPLQQSAAGLHFSAGDVEAGAPITLAAELRDASNRLVGFGSISDPVTPSGSDDVSVTIPVRKPIVYVASDVPVNAIDPTRDNLDPKYQSSLPLTGVVVVPVDGTEIAVITTTSVQRYATSTHASAGKAIVLSFGTPLDAAPVPGQRRIVVGTTNGIAVVDVDAGTVATINGQRADRVTVGVVDGTATAFALSSRVQPAIGASGTCMGSSTVYSVAIDAMGAPMQIASGAPLADIAAEGAAVFGANPCAGQVKRLDQGGQFSMTLPGAAALAIESHQLWAVGSAPPTSTAGAHLVIASSAIDGSGQRQVALAPKSEIMTFDGDPDQELSIFLHADTEVPLDLVVLPHADQVAIVARMDTHRAARYDTFNTKVIPEMQASVWDVLLSDPVSGATTRIRAMCKLQVIQGSVTAEFPDWSCAIATDGEAPTGGEFTPVAVGAVYGSR
jgi:hypothetical protein